MAEFWDGYVFPTIIIVAQILLVVVPLLGAVAYLTYAERKVIGAMQLRKGPNVVGWFGLLQPIAANPNDFNLGVRVNHHPGAFAVQTLTIDDDQPARCQQ